MTSLAGRRVLVTGGSMGIGRAVAEEIASRGGRLILVARGPEALKEAASGLAGEGHEWRAFDVSEPQPWAMIAHDFPELDGLVCAAAVIDPVGPVGSYAISAFRRTIEINLIGSLLAVAACRDALARTHGSIVFFGGGGATSPLPRYDAYAASKAAVVRLAENMAGDLADIGVRINSVAPGFVITRMHDATLAAGPDGAGTEYFERTRRGIDEGGTPASEAAGLVARLLEGVDFSGKLVSAAWDPWRDDAFLARLAADRHLGTVRRIDDVQFQEIA